jgi:thiamine biosynthesis lipoprotein
MDKKISRRKFVRITAIGAGILAVGGFSLKETLKESGIQAYEETRPLLGTYITIKAIDIDEDKAKTAIIDTFAEINRLSSILSRHDPASELYRLNNNKQIIGASTELVAVLEKAQQYSELTEGAFDVTVMPLLDIYQTSFKKKNGAPDTAALNEAGSLVGYKMIKISGHDVVLEKDGAVTLDGIAKGYIVDKAATCLRERMMNRVIVEAGGDLSLSGTREDGQPWRVGITHPRAMGGYYEVFESSSGCLATSGDYENSFTSDYRYHHIIDPRQGLCPTELASASVLANDTSYADALSTACLVLGTQKALALVESLPGVEALLIDKDLINYKTRGFPPSAAF